MNTTEKLKVVTTFKLGICSLLVSLLVSGCISGSSDIHYGSNGPVAGRETLRQIKPNKTTKEWVLATLGEPTCTRGTPEGTEILKYEYVKKVNGCFSISPFLDLHEKRTEHRKIYFEVQNGIVTKFWKD